MAHPPVHFLERLRQQGVTEGVVAAFAAIPRTHFISGFYQRLQTEKRENAYRYVTRESVGEEQWCRMIYQDTPLITQLGANNVPASSSSQPGLMGQMIDALQIRPGQRILEIGTGTGYNAAILAFLTKSPHLVTTIDIEPRLVERAALSIEEAVGEGMHLVVGNGLQGVPEYGPYDYILVTGAYHTIPRAWLDQLAPGGTLLMDYHKHFGNVMLLMQKNQQGDITGQALPIHALFMPLHQGSIEGHIPSVRLQPIDPVLAPLSASPLRPDHFRVKEELAFFLHCHFPQMAILRFWKGNTSYTFLADAETKRLVQFYQESIRGDHQLWQELLYFHHEWKQQDCPNRTSYTFVIEDDQYWAILGDKRWNLGTVA
jgi:protein-L-isoaspartate(D-aspartate) O-methyltransferase